MKPTSSKLRTLAVAKSLVWDMPKAMLLPEVQESRVARMGIRCIWFVAPLMLLPPLVVVTASFTLPIVVASVIETILVASAVGVGLGTAAVLGAAARRGKFGEQTRYWRDTVRDGLTDWRNGL